MVGVGPAGTEFTVDMTRLLTTGRTIIGVTEGDRRPDQLIPALLELHRQGRFPVDRLITRYPLAEINQAVADTEAGRAVKAVLEPAGSRSG